MWGGRSAAVRAAGALAGWNQWPAVWTAVSEAAAVDMRRVIRTRPVVVVPNAVDVDWWRRTSQESTTAARTGVTLISVMRLAGRKRPLALARMLRDVRGSVPHTIPLKAVIVGDGPLEGRLRSTLERLGMTDWVSMPGCISRKAIRDRYRTADLYLAPAHRESFGIAALEARAAGLPVVAMRSGGVGEFIQDGVEGLLCDDDLGMARAVAHLVSQREALAGMAAHNTAFAPKLGWDAVLDRFSRAYVLAAESQLAGRSRRRSLAVPAAVFDNG
jgi:glycosyltransferase involved in cell wall biosynthesis